MTSARPDDGNPALTRRGPLVAEIAALVLLVAVDAVSILGEPPARGVAGLVAAVVPGLGPVAAVLAVLRRRLVTRIGLLGGGVVAISLLNTALSALAHGHQTPGLTEILPIALLIGAGCRRLDRYAAIGLATAGGVAMTVAPVLRYGAGSSAALLAVPAALLWGGSLAVGLVLRDADDRLLAALAEARTDERLRLARELHDFVAHHVTGIAVRAQAAVSQARELRPDVTLMDIRMPRNDGLQATRLLAGPDVPDPMRFRGLKAIASAPTRPKK
jgi:signal transduction histidine kinase